MRLIREVREFFESYELMNVMFDQKGVDVNIFEATSRNVLQIKIIESPLKGTARQKAQRNMFYDAKVEKNMIKMTFKYKGTKMSDEFIDKIKSIKKNDYTIKIVGNQISLTIIDPRITEISKIFAALEPYCKRFNIN